MTELALLEKVELKIALADDGAPLESALNLYLAPVLLKLSSPDALVRKAVLKIIQHIIPRLTADRHIKLPVDALLEQVKNPKISHDSDPLSVRLYSLLFIVRGVERLDNAAKTALIGQVVDGISSFSDLVRARLFCILCKLIAAPVPDDLTISDADQQYLADTVAKFFMLPPTTSGSTAAAPGLTKENVSFFNQDAGIQLSSNQEIHQIKLRLLEFLKHGFSDSFLYVPLLVLTADSSSAVNELAETHFKRLKTTLDQTTAEHILAKFIGKNAPPVSSVLQERTLSVILKSAPEFELPYLSEIAAIGLSSSNARLKVTTVKLIQWVSKSSTKGHVLGSEVLEQLKSDIMGMGWPKMEVSAVKNYATAISQRALEYETFGNILCSDSKLLGENLENIDFLLKSLQGEDPDIRSTIQDNLSSLTSELTGVNQKAKDQIKVLARKYFQDASESAHSCRYIIIKFLIAVFPFEDPEARLFCIMGAASNNRLDTIEEATKGLHPYWFNLSHSSTSSSLSSTAELMGQKSTSQFPAFEDMMGTLSAEVENPALSNSIDKAIEFAVRCLVMRSVKGNSTVVVVDEDWSSRIDKALETDEQVRTLVIKEVRLLRDSSAMETLLRMISEAFIGQFSGSFPRSEIYGSYFVKLLAISPDEMTSSLTESLPTYVETLSLKTLTDSLSDRLCHVIGIIGTHGSVSDLWILETLAKLNANSGPDVKSSLLTTACLISRLVLRNRVDTLKGDVVDSYVNKLMSLIESDSTYQSAIQCVGELAAFGAFNRTLSLVSDIESKANKMLKTITSKVKKGDEKSISTIAKLGLVIESPTEGASPLTEVEQVVYETHVSKLIDVLFTSGEALLILGAGWNSLILQQQLDIQGCDLKYANNNDSRLPIILDYILDASKSTKPSLRKACCLWLLSVVQYCKNLEPVKHRAAEIHVAFMKFLVDRDDLVQELASRGLSMVYELGDHELKDSLVRGLLKSFTDSSSSQGLTSGSVDLETELFAPDVLKTDDGSVSTYKDVLSLASDVGDPSLVYKFMSLAKSSALWSSRRGMAFGLGSVMSKTSLAQLLDDNKAMANKLIPKLYRYRYDPSTSVSQSMNDIWNSLIDDPTAIIRANFDLILKELLKEVGNKEWRVRQGSVTALTDLLQTTSLDVYEDRMEEIWSMSFRAIDDIKDSVRKAGTKLTRSLATTLTRAADVSTGSSDSRATKVLGDLIPFLIGNQGLLSDAEDVRTFSLETILKVCKVAGPRIKKFVPTLLENFITMMSTLEPDVVNYLVLNAEKYNLTSNEIDAQRLQSLGRSPLMDAIEQLLLTVDSELMPEVVNCLIHTIKKSVGLPSKVCGSRVLVTFVQKHLELTKPYGNKLLQCAIGQIHDRNETIASSYATAAGYLCRVSTVDAIVLFGNQLTELYFQSEDENKRHITALASEAVSKYSADKFDLIMGAFLPLCFIGKHDVATQAATPFEREWIEHTSGNSAMKLYFDEIVTLAAAQIDSNSYTIRRIVALSMAELCNVIGEGSGLSPKSGSRLLSLLMEACRGKSWSGKEVIYDVLVTTSIRLKDAIAEDDMRFAAICKIVVTESKRRNKEYQRKAILLTGRFLFQFPDPDVVETYTNVVESYLWPSHDDDASDVEMEENEPRFSSRQNIKIEEEKLSLIKNIFETINPETFNDELFQLALDSVIKLFSSEEVSVTWRSKRNCNEWMIACLSSLLSASTKLNKKDAQLLLQTWIKISDVCLLKNEIEAVQIQCLRCATEVMKAVETVVDSKTFNVINDRLKQFRALDLSAVVLRELEKTTSYR